ncbi:unnamed protein product [Effrenium voratum]|nr:unnamed protein product [Effrenium voratum]
MAEDAKALTRKLKAAEPVRVVEVLQKAQQQNLRLNLIHLNTALAVLADQREPPTDTARWQDACQLAERIPQMFVETDVVSSNILLRSPGWQQAQLDLRTFTEVTYVALGGKLDWPQVLRLLWAMRQSRGVGLAAYNAALVKLLWPQSMELLRWMPRSRLRPDVLSYTTVASQDSWLGAVNTLCDLCLARWQLDVVCCSTVLTSCVEANHWLQALRFQQVSWNQYCYNAILRGLRWQLCQHVFEEMVDVSLRPDAASQSLLTNSLAQAGLWRSALVSLSSYTYNSVLRCLVEASAWRRAFDLKGAPQPDSVVLSVATQNWPAALQVLAKQSGGGRPCSVRFGGPWRSALHLALHSIGGSWQRAVVQGERHELLSAQQSAGHWRGALASVLQMRWAELRLDTADLNMAISACEKSSTWRRGANLHRAMLAARLSASLETTSTCIKAYSTARRWAWALHFLRGGVDAAGAGDFGVLRNAGADALAKCRRWRQAVLLTGAASADVLFFSSLLTSLPSAALPAPMALNLVLTMDTQRVSLDVARTETTFLSW